MKSDMRWAWIGSLIVVFWGCTQSSPAGGNGSVELSDSLLEELCLQVARSEALPVEVRVPGEVVSVPEKTVQVRALTSGTLVEVFVRTGERVQQGLPLVRIRSPELLAWEAQYQSLQARIAAQREKVQAMERLARDSLASSTEVSASRAELFSMEAEAQGLAHQLRLFQRSGMDFLVLAPRKGVVTRLSVSAGTQVQPGDLLVEIADLARVRFIVYLYPEQLGHALPGMEAEATFPEVSGPVPFRIAGFLPTVDPQSRAAMAYADVPNPQFLLRPGAYFQARLKGYQSDSAVAVPASALVLDADQHYALVYRQRSWEVRPVQIRRLLRDKAYIQGVVPGETLATRKVLFLYQQLTRSL